MTWRIDYCSIHNRCVFCSCCTAMYSVISVCITLMRRCPCFSWTATHGSCSVSLSEETGVMLSRSLRGHRLTSVHKYRPTRSTRVLMTSVLLVKGTNQVTVIKMLWTGPPYQTIANREWMSAQRLSSPQNYIWHQGSPKDRRRPRDTESQMITDDSCTWCWTLNSSIIRFDLMRFNIVWMFRIFSILYYVHSKHRFFIYYLFRFLFKG